MEFYLKSNFNEGYQNVMDVMLTICFSYFEVIYTLFELSNSKY